MIFVASSLAGNLWAFGFIVIIVLIFVIVLARARETYIKSDKYLSGFAKLLWPAADGPMQQPYEKATYDLLFKYLADHKLSSTGMAPRIVRIYEKADGSRIYQMLSHAPRFFAKGVRANGNDTTTYFLVKDNQIVKMCLAKDLYSTAF